MTRQAGPTGPCFAVAKLRAPVLPTTIVRRSELLDRLTTGAAQRLTLVVGPAGSGKTTLLSSWAEVRSAAPTAWLSCDAGDARPARFWHAFIEAIRSSEPGFGAEATELLEIDGDLSPDVTASLVNDAAELPAGTAIVVDDFHNACPAIAPSMTDLIARWPSETAQLVLATRLDPVVRLDRLRMSSDLCELRESQLRFSPAESRAFLANFGVIFSDDELAVLHERAEGWAAALQMVALSLRGTTDPVRKARALDLRSHGIADYFTSEVLDQQPPELAQFMLDISVLCELTAGACAAVSGRQDAAALLRELDTAGLFLVRLDDERGTFRYQHLVRQLLCGELRARERDREQALHLRAADWFESAGDIRRASRHLLAAKQTDRALTLLQERMAAQFMCESVLQPPPDLSTIDPRALSGTPDRLLTLGAELLMSGDVARGGELLDLLDRADPPISPESPLAGRRATAQALRHMLLGQAEPSLASALTARQMRDRAQDSDPWIAALPLIEIRPYTWLEDYQAVERAADQALAMPELAEPVERVLIPGARAAAQYDRGDLADAAGTAMAAEKEARRMGCDRHFVAADYLRVLARVALERRDFESAEQFAEQALSVSEDGPPALVYLALLDRAEIWAARGQIREGLTTVDTARQVLANTGSVLLARADEVEATLRLSLGDVLRPGELAARLTPARRSLLQARISLACHDAPGARRHLDDPSLSRLSPRRTLTRQILLAAAAASSRDTLTATRVLAEVIELARREGYVHTVVSTAPALAAYLVEHSVQVQPDHFVKKLIAASLELRAAQPGEATGGGQLAEPLTDAELRVLRLLPTSTYLQMSQVLYISRNTVKTHLRSIYHKLLVTSRSEAIQRAVDLRLL